MRHKEKLFKLLRSAVETPLENAAVEDFIKKVDGDGLKVEQIDETHQKFNGIVYGRNLQRNDHFFKLVHLHRAVWTYYFGEIPDGYVIHHIDGDKSNNDISNLAIMTRIDHMKLHKSSIQKPQKHTKKTKFKCIVCGKEYESVNNGRNLYCSKECLEQYKKTQLYAEIRICRFCGKEFLAYKYGDQKFCSHKCSTDYTSQQNCFIKICPKCGKEFSTLKHENHTYCSPECGNASRRCKETIVCAQCGKTFQSKPSNHRKYCSRACYNAARHHDSYKPKLATHASKTEIGPVKNRE